MTTLLDDRQIQQVHHLAEVLGGGGSFPHVGEIVEILMTTCVTASRSLQAQAGSDGLAGGEWDEAQEQSAREYAEQFSRLSNLCEKVRRLIVQVRTTGVEVGGLEAFAEACEAADFAGPRFEQRLAGSKAVAAGRIPFTPASELRDALRGRLDAGSR